MRVLLALILGLAALLTPPVAAVPSYITFPSDIDWMRRRSPHFEIIYRKGQDDFAARTLRAAERAHAKLAPLFPKGPESTYIVLADFQDSTNGYALNIPYSHFVIFASPPEASGTLAALDDWLDAVVLHEYVHILHLYPANGLWKWMRFFFGPVILPIGILPTHFHEGLATFYETELTTGGRGKGAEYRMLRRMAVEENAWGDSFAPFDTMDGTATRYPGGVSPYFFGYHLYAELWKRRGSKGFYRLTESYSDNWPTYIDGPLEEVYGADYATLWKTIFEKTGAEAKAEIESIKREGLSPVRWLTESRFAKWDMAVSPDGKRVAYRAADPWVGTRIDILELRTRKIADSMDTVGGRVDGLCWGRSSRQEWLVYVDTEMANQYSTNALRARSPGGNRSWRLSAKDEPLDHVHALGCSSDLARLLVYRESAGAGEVVDLRWSPEDERQRTVPTIVRRWKLPTGSWVLSVLGGETGWISLRDGASTQLLRWSPGDTAPVKVFESPARFFGLRRGPSPKELYAVADIDGRHEISRVAVDRREATKAVSALGGILAFDQRGGRFVAASYRHGGFDIVLTSGGTGGVPPTEARSSTKSRVAAKRSSGRTVRLGIARRAPKGEGSRSAAAESADETKLGSPESYTPWSTLYPRSWIPSLLFVQDGLQVGFWVPGFDLSQKHSYDIMGGYDIRGVGSRPFLSVDYRYRFHLASVLDAGAYYSPSYVFLGAGSGFQNTYGAGVGLTTQVLGLPPTWRLGLIARRTEPFGNTAANQAIGVSLTGSYAFGFHSRPLDVSPRRGTRLSVTHQHFFRATGSTQDYFRTTAQLDQYLAAPWLDGHAWYLSIRAGYTAGVDFFNSFFQGGGEILFSQGRGFFLARGFSPGIFLSRQMYTANLEYRFPITRIDCGPGLRPVFLKRIHAALTLDALTQKGRVTGRSPFEVYFVGTGGEIRTDWTLFYYLPAQLRAGLYHGLGPAGEELQVVLGIEASL